MLNGRQDASLQELNALSCCCTFQVVFRLLLDRGDAVLCEEFTYPHIAESLVGPQGFVAVPLAMDSHGIVPSLLRRTLEGMRAAARPLPRLLYTVPVGQNPTGAVPEGNFHGSLRHCRCSSNVTAAAAQMSLQALHPIANVQLCDVPAGAVHAMLSNGQALKWAPAGFQ